MAGSEPLIQEADPHITKLSLGAQMSDKIYIPTNKEFNWDQTPAEADKWSVSFRTHNINLFIKAR